MEIYPEFDDVSPLMSNEIYLVQYSIIQDQFVILERKSGVVHVIPCDEQSEIFVMHDAIWYANQKEIGMIDVREHACISKYKIPETTNFRVGVGEAYMVDLQEYLVLKNTSALLVFSQNDNRIAETTELDTFDVQGIFEKNGRCIIQCSIEPPDFLAEEVFPNYYYLDVEKLF